MKLEDLYKKDQQIFIRIINRYVHDPTVAEDIVQDAFTKACLVAAQYDPDKSGLKTWFNKILFSAIWDHKRKSKKCVTTVDITDYMDSLDISTPHDDVSESIKAAILAIRNTTHQTVLLSYYVLGYGTKEIEGVLGIKEANSRKIIQRFRPLLGG